jgi:molybdopterin-guanine dinucleotide biosynthesis protein A
MGSDKALVSLGDRTLLERAIATLASVTEHVVLATGATPRYAELGLPIALDRWADAGPLAGLEAALARAPEGFVVVCACDMPRVDAQLLEALVARATESDADVCLLRTEGGVEPLCGVYHTRVLVAIRAALDAGERKVLSFLRFTLSDGRAPRAIDASERELVGETRERSAGINLNTPEDLAAERAQLGSRAASHARETLP